jgi:hypothetical protein
MQFKLQPQSVEQRKLLWMKMEVKKEEVQQLVRLTLPPQLDLGDAHPLVVQPMVGQRQPQRPMQVSTASIIVL